MSEKTVIHSDILSFRRTEEKDLEAVLDLERGTDNSRFIRHWPIELHRAAIADPNIAHVIVETTGKRRLIGYVILIGLENPDSSIEFKRIVIAEKGRGYGREAVKLIKQYIFNSLGKHRLWLEVMDYNHRAFALYNSEGFVLEGTHRGAVKQGEIFTSLRVMSMLADEYQAQTKQ